ncbi:hypothetical protein AYL99_02396 [Fonsecaea erecta]|uniref:Uncharacterized protein n=1 Tax=Fonsecaea erecta TaxID=1367422 RepID=A0A178ZTS3_9EURO|nr:hypothetical protein AYL99_02396 [Fonsecaea erecta]OAP63169.1 hypothetical protein AYL99_02396 [Fonsecaea erecta]
MAAASTTSWAPWKVLLKWEPFHIDALGLVTLLGAEEVDAAVGRLVSSAYLEYFPLLGAYVIAGNRFIEKAAGFNLYNISQGIHTTDLAAWLTRWMLSQEFEATRNFVEWTVTEPRSRKGQIAFSLAISFVFNGFLVAGTILSKDWYGFANAIAMIVSIGVRAYVIGQQRIGFDAMIDKVVKAGSLQGHNYKTQWKPEKKQETKSGLRYRGAASVLEEAQSNGSNSSSPLNGQKQLSLQTGRPTRSDPKAFDEQPDGWTGTPTKVLIIQSDSKPVTFWMPNELLVAPSVFIEGPVILNPKKYFIMRCIGWLVFAVHIVAIGMADLASQMYTVVLMVLPTILLISKVGCDDSEWLTNFQGWVRRKLHGGEKQEDHQPDHHHDDAEKSVKPTDFRKVRHCYVGSRLRADIYEWPESYDFHEEGDGKDKKWVSGRKEGQERSKKRQDLYAWLALTPEEEASMDKWDLFPHTRQGNTSWLQTYKIKRDMLKGDKRNSKGPQQPLDTDIPPTTPVVTSDSPQEDRAARPFPKPRRTATNGFLAQGASSAFPAISDQEEQIQADEDAQTDVAQMQTVGDTAAQPADSDVATAGRPHVTIQLPGTPPPSGRNAAAAADVVAGSGALTQSPTTNDSPREERPT